MLFIRVKQIFEFLPLINNHLEPGGRLGLGSEKIG
jgi:hypothetical protein